MSQGRTVRAIEEDLSQQILALGTDEVGSQQTTNDHVSLNLELLPRKVPITILTGFLGAGKTTLLKYILTEHHGKRIAVIQNEFADEMGIESPVIVDRNGDLVRDVYELPNGCLCCSVRDDLVATLDALLQSSGNRFDYVLVETSGVADPEPLVSAFWVDQQLESHVYLDGIVTVVDAHNVQRIVGNVDLTDGNDSLVSEFQCASLVNEVDDVPRMTVKQIVCADCILINKTDLVGDATEAENIEKWCRGLNPSARILRTERCRVDLDLLLSLRAFDTSSLILGDVHENFSSGKESQVDKNQNSLEIPPEEGGETISGQGLEKIHRLHRSNANSRISNLMLSVETVIEPEARSEEGSGYSSRKLLSLMKINKWMAETLWHCGGDDSNRGEVYRCKGLLWAVDDVEFPDRTQQFLWSTDGGGYSKNSRNSSRRCGVGWYAIQGVGRTFEFEALDQHLQTSLYMKSCLNSSSAGGHFSKFLSKMLIVGRNLDDAALIQSFEACTDGQQRRLLKFEACYDVV